MAKAKDFLRTVSQVEKILNFIEQSNKTSGQIIYDLQEKFSYSRKALDKRFKDVYLPPHGHKDTLSSYIKRRKSTQLDHEEKYDISHIKNIAYALYLLEDYNFCKVDITKEKITLWENKKVFYTSVMSEINLKKMFYTTLSNDIYLYYYTGKQILSAEDVFEFNLKYLNKANHDKSHIIKKYLEFCSHYINQSNNNIILINNLVYITNSRHWIKTNFKTYTNINIPKDATKYKTILQSTKGVLRVLKDQQIQNHNQPILKIETEEDIKIQYQKSIEEVLSKIHPKEKKIFEAILSIEEGDNKPSDILVFNQLLSSNKIYLYTLLIKGMIYIA